MSRLTRPYSLRESRLKGSLAVLMCQRHLMLVWTLEVHVSGTDKSPRALLLLLRCPNKGTPFQTTPHLTSLDRSARQPTTHKQFESKNTRSIWQLYSSPSAVSSKVPSSISSPRPFSPGTRKANTPTPVSVLLVNAIAVLSEDRFLARSTYSTITPA